MKNRVVFVLGALLLSTSLRAGSETDQLKTWLESLSNSPVSVQQLQKWKKEKEFARSEATSYLAEIRKRVIDSHVKAVEQLENGTCPTGDPEKWETANIVSIDSKRHEDFEGSLVKVESIRCIHNGTAKAARDLLLVPDFRKKAVAQIKASTNANGQLCDRMEGKSFTPLIKFPWSSYCVQLQNFDSAGMSSVHSDLVHTPMDEFKKDAPYYLRDGVISFVNLPQGGVGSHAIVFLRGPGIPGIAKGKALSLLSSFPMKAVIKIDEWLAPHAAK
jgi:hypothetical protein